MSVVRGRTALAVGQAFMVAMVASRTAQAAVTFECEKEVPAAAMFRSGCTHNHEYCRACGVRFLRNKLGALEFLTIPRTL